MDQPGRKRGLDGEQEAAAPPKMASAAASSSSSGGEGPNRKRAKFRHYVDSEAEVSGDDASADEDEAADDQPSQADLDFIDDRDDDEEDGDDDYADDRGRKQKKRRRRRAELIVQDELDLIRENTGQQVRVDIDADISESESDSEEDEAGAGKKKRRLRRAKSSRSSKASRALSAAAAVAGDAVAPARAPEDDLNDLEDDELGGELDMVRGGRDDMDDFIEHDGSDSDPYDNYYDDEDEAMADGDDKLTRAFSIFGDISSFLQETSGRPASASRRRRLASDEEEDLLDLEEAGAEAGADLLDSDLDEDYDPDAPEGGSRAVKAEKKSGAAAGRKAAAGKGRGGAGGQLRRSPASTVATDMAERLQLRRPLVAMMVEQGANLSVVGVGDPASLAKQLVKLETGQFVQDEADELNDIADPDTLEEEARWIYHNAFAQPQLYQAPHTQQRAVRLDNRSIPTIQRVLNLIRLEGLEVPFIARYRRKDWCDRRDPESPGNLTEDDLWTIDEWDNRWAQMMDRRRALLRKLVQADSPLEYTRLCRSAATPRELNDLQDWLRHRSMRQELKKRSSAPASSSSGSSSSSSSSSSSDVVRPKQELLEDAEQQAEQAQQAEQPPQPAEADQDDMDLGLGLGLSPADEASAGVAAEAQESLVAKLERVHRSFTLSPTELRANFRYAVNPQRPPQPPLDPEVSADGLLGDQLPTTDHVLRAVRRSAVMELTADPLMKQLVLDEFRKRCVIDTYPTRKGRRDVDWTHPHFAVKRLAGKPYLAFVREFPEQYALVDEAVNQGLIRVVIRMARQDERPGALDRYGQPLQLDEKTAPREGIDAESSLGMDFFHLYCAEDAVEPAALAWDEQRRMVVTDALQAFGRYCVDSIHEELLRMAQEEICRRAAAKLRVRLAQPAFGWSSVSEGWRAQKSRRQKLRQEQRKAAKAKKLARLAKQELRKQKAEEKRRRRAASGRVKSERATSDEEEDDDDDEEDADAMVDDDDDDDDDDDRSGDEDDEDGEGGRGGSQAAKVDPNRPRPFRIVSCLVGDQHTATVFACLNHLGDVVDHISLSFLKTRVGGGRNSPPPAEDRAARELHQADVQKFQAFLGRNDPALLLIGASGLEVQEFRRTLEEHVLYDFADLRVEYADPEVSAVVANTARSRAEMPAYSASLRQAVGLGRHALDPVGEIAGLWREHNILSLALHPQQASAPRRMLLAALGQALCRSVNDLGVDLNRVLPRPFAQGSLPWVAGLGPAKAQALVAGIRGTRGFAVSRLALRDQRALQSWRALAGSLGGQITMCPDERYLKAAGALPPVVFRNAAGFLIVEHSSREDRMMPLDRTRIHPQIYDLAFQVVLNALDCETQVYEEEAAPQPLPENAEDSEEAQEQRQQQLERRRKALQKRHQQEVQRVLQVLGTAEGAEKLDQLDLDAFADILEQEGRPLSTGWNLRLLDEELRRPFGPPEFVRLLHPQQVWAAPTPGELYHLLTGETETSLRRHMLISVRVNSWNGKGINCRLDNGLFGFIPLIYVSDSPPVDLMEGPGSREHIVDWLGQRVQRGMTIQCRVMHINKERLAVDLTSRSLDLRRQLNEAELREVLGLLHDPSWIPMEPTPEDLAGGPRKNRGKPFIERPIKHPAFRNVTREQARAALVGMRPGEVLIRPSSAGPARLTFSYKVLGSAVPPAEVETRGDGNTVCFHLGVIEEDKPTPLALGNRLLIGDREFEDLDEIISRFVQPIVRHCQALAKHEKFVAGGPGEAARWVKHQRTQAPNRLHYCLSLDEADSCAVFSYLPGNTVRTVKIGVTPKGFRFQGKDLGLDQLVPALKMHLSAEMASKRPQHHQAPVAAGHGVPYHHPQRPVPQAHGSGSSYSAGYPHHYPAQQPPPSYHHPSRPLPHAHAHSHHHAEPYPEPRHEPHYGTPSYPPSHPQPSYGAPHDPHPHPHPHPYPSHPHSHPPSHSHPPHPQSHLPPNLPYHHPSRPIPGSQPPLPHDDYHHQRREQPASSWR